VDAARSIAVGPSEGGWEPWKAAGMSLLLLLNGSSVTTVEQLPAVVLKAVIVAGEATREGTLIEGVALPWFEILELIHRDPSSVYQIGWRKWEEIVAGAYERAGFDQVVLTPRSGNKGRDVLPLKTASAPYESSFR